MPQLVQNEAPYLSGSLAVPSGNAAVTLTLPLGSLLLTDSAAGTPVLFDAKQISVAIANIGTGQTINAASLVLSDTLGTQTVSITNALTSVSIATNANGVYVTSLNTGLLKMVSLTVAFASAPTTGSLSVQATVQGAAGATPGSGSAVSLAASSVASGAYVDGAITTLGAEADAAVTDATQTTKTLMAYVKGWIKILADVWDSTNHLLHINNKQVGGTAISVNTGTVDAGTQRMTLATDVNVPGNVKQLNGTTVSVNAGNRDAGTQRVKQAGNGTATITQVTSSATSGQALAANTNKEGTSFFNASNQICYLLYGSGTASSTNYTTQIAPNQLYEDPWHFTGIFTVVWVAANGFLYCTEIS